MGSRLTFPYRWSHRLRAALTAIAIGLLPACTGILGDGPEDGVVNPNGEAASFVGDHSRFPRLSHEQWENTVKDLLRLPATPGLSASFTTDPLGGKTFDNNESKLEVTPGLWADYQRAAEELSVMVTSDPALLAKILPANMPADPAARAKAYIEAFGRRAFRRPLVASEVDSYVALFNKGPEILAGPDPFADGVALTLQAFLQSPYFVYRTELGSKPRNDGLIPLSGYEIATKLSYTLWNTMPDDKLLDAAGAGELDTPAGVRAYAEAMLDDPQGRATVASYHRQLYGYKRYHELYKDPGKFPQWSDTMGEDLETESKLFLNHIVFEQEAGLTELLTSRTAFVNDKLAAIYGLGDGFTSDFKQVELDPKTRSGFLTRAGFLASYGTAETPDSILRGVFVNRRFICANLPDPPDMVPPVPPGPDKTNRERIETHTGAGTCGASCHGTMINPAGFAFEHYDAIGQYITTDNGFDINSADSYPFQSGTKSYADAIEFSQVLAEGEEAHRCYAGFWLTFAYGRDLQDADDALLDKLAEESRGGAPIKEIILKLIESDAFLTRAPVEAP
ncbi:MAG: DUF1592 domain-containing protein [Polyangiaceae bacterium]|nr:DUF1592 domain-containing protein [Polyangiaceae bacterium]